MVHYGNHAEKRNLIDVFFNQDRGILVILGLIPITFISWYMGDFFLSLPSIPYPTIEGTWPNVAWNIGLVAASVLGFYWFRYGGTLSHDDKPEWDTIPTVVKEDIFFARATVPDLCALETVLKHPLRDEYTASAEDIDDAIHRIVPKEYKDSWRDLNTPLHAFKRVASGPRIDKPQHIFFIVGESIPQWSLDEPYKDLNICPGLWDFKDNPHTAQVPNFLPAGNVSRPSIVSLLSGVYDAGMEINEREAFWHEPLPTSLASQMKRLGYDTIYWYGGNASYGNFNHFGKAQEFDRVESASVFCGPDAPKTWVGVYDHVFLEHIEENSKFFHSSIDQLLIYHYTKFYCSFMLNDLECTKQEYNKLERMRNTKIKGAKVSPLFNWEFMDAIYLISRKDYKQSYNVFKSVNTDNMNPREKVQYYYQFGLLCNKIKEKNLYNNYKNKIINLKGLSNTCKKGEIL